MPTKIMENSIIISKDAIQRIGGMVILSLGEYEKLRQNTAPVYQLIGREAEELEKLVKDGLEEHRAGKCRAIKSLADLD